MTSSKIWQILTPLLPPCQLLSSFQWPPLPPPKLTSSFQCDLILVLKTMISLRYGYGQMCIFNKEKKIQCFSRIISLPFNFDFSKEKKKKAYLHGRIMYNQMTSTSDRRPLPLEGLRHLWMLPYSKFLWVNKKALSASHHEMHNTNEGKFTTHNITFNKI